VRRLPIFPALGPAPATIRVQAGREVGGRAQVTSFLPTSVAARPGDTLRFVNPTLDTPHTVTSGLADDKATWPVALLADARPNPAWLQPCVAAGRPGPAADDCPTPAPSTGAGGAIEEPFAGQGFYNTGLLDPGAALDVHLGPTLAPGAYVFRCLIHRGMDLSVRVEEPGAAIPGQAAVDALADEQATTDVRTARPPVPPDGTAGAFAVGGWGRGVTVDRVTPAVVSVRAGEVVSWRNFGVGPHSVAFGSDGRADRVLAAGPASLGEEAGYGGGFAYSGWISAAVGRATFSLRFMERGRYPFRCVFHPGMTGLVIVG